MIPIYMVIKDANTVQSLDDPNVYTDDGNAYTMTIKSSPRIFPEGTDFGVLTSFLQNVYQTSGATVKATPWMDGKEITSQEITRTKVAGDKPSTSFPFHADGSIWQVAVEISSFTNRVALGRATQYIAQKRSEP